MFLRRTRRILTLLFELAEDRVLDLTLYGPSSSGFAADGPNCLVFRVGEGAHAYLSSSRRRGFGVAPERDHFGLPPQTECRLQGEVKLDGGRATLWLIEYDDKQRLCHRTVGLRSGRLEFTWRTHPSHRRLCLAVRLTGEGGLRLSRLSLMPKDNAGRRVGKVDTGDVGNLRVGSRGGFRSYSIFGDPSGYLRYTARHHKFYENRESSWYERIARRFADCTNVLDVGCGPGLLLEALKSAGVSNGIGLERDPEYLRMCRERGLDVTSHDLNEPFPFLESNRFDAVIAHHTFDYLAPIALRVTLREIARVLRPDGRLYLVACRLGRQAADVTRTARLSPGRLREALNEAGFEDIRMTESARSVVVEAMWSADETCWQGGPVTLSSGAPLYPFASPRTVLSPSPQSWDNLSCRDLTLLTDARKNEVRIGGRLVGYFSAYHDTGRLILRAVCRAVSDDGMTWRREPGRPVLSSGDARAWDAGVVGTGSVIDLGEDAVPSRYVMYFGGRTAAGRVTGIGLARSDEGINWDKLPSPILSIADYPGLRDIAIPDVIRTSDGRWLMHCEGWIEGRGWAVFQAQSEDGIRWHPTQKDPVLNPADIPWGGLHTANPKCLEVEDGRFLLGFNAADRTVVFRLGLAESTDARRWRLLQTNPVIVPGRGDYRVESFFITRQSWEEQGRRVYYFASTTKQTHRSSRILVTQADTDALWLGGDWTVSMPALCRIRSGRLSVDPDPARDTTAEREYDICGETQVTFRLAGNSPAKGSVILEWSDNEKTCRLDLDPDGEVNFGNVVLAGPPQAGEALSVAVRLIGTEESAREITVDLWHGISKRVSRQVALPFAPTSLHVTLRVPAGGQPLIIENLDVWQPDVCRMGWADAHMYMGSKVTGNPLLPEVGPQAFRRVLREHDIEYALVASYGSGPKLDAFEQIAGLAREMPANVYPLFRFQTSRELNPKELDSRCEQLETVWREGRLYGLKIKMNLREIPPEAVLDWVERRRVLTMWHAACIEDLRWLRENVLSRYTFPVLLSHFGGYPLDSRRYAEAVSMLDEFEELYLVTSVVWFEYFLHAAVRKHPRRVLLGSDFPAVNPSVAREAVLKLDVDDESKALVCSENLRFLLERVLWHRWNALNRPDGRESHAISEARDTKKAKAV